MAARNNVTADSIHKGLPGFGLRLFAQLCADTSSSNVILSPYVVGGALSLAVAGATAGGTAEAEILTVLGISSHADFAASSAALLSGHGASLQAANGVFLRNDVKPEYVALVHSAHGAKAAVLGETFTPLNTWVEEKTEGRIKDFLADPPDPLLVAVLVSAVFFKGSWAARFDPTATSAATFTSIDGASLPMQQMRRKAKMWAAKHVGLLAGASAVRLDYGASGPWESTHDYCAVFILPQQAGASALTATLTALAATPMRDVLDELREQEVALALPKMRLSYGTVSLKSTLRKLGLSTAFDGSSVFAGMSEDPTVHIGDVVTKAVLEIDEEGTVAAAAAAVKMTKRCAPSPPLELKFDRPFIVAILHAISGMPLFLALVHSPD